MRSGEAVAHVERGDHPRGPRCEAKFAPPSPLTLANAMYAPVCTRFMTYGVPQSEPCAAYRDHVLAWRLLVEWTEAAREEPDDIDKLDMKF